MGLLLLMGNKGGNTNPAYIETISTGMWFQTPDNVSGTLEIAVTGTAGSATLTTAETAKVSAIGGTTKLWEAALISNDGQQMFFAYVIGNNGSTTITLLSPLTADFTGVISPKYDAAFGQHLSTNGTKAYAKHVASQTGIFCSRGAVLDQAWTNGPSSSQTAWARNAALVAYGVVNSAAPIVQTSLSSSPGALNLHQNSRSINPTSLANRGVTVGTHTTGHGLVGTFNGQSKPVVLEFWTSAYRLSTTLSGVQLAVEVTNNGVSVYSTTANENLNLHRIYMQSGGTIVATVTNTDGAIYQINLSQCTLREAGSGAELITSGKKVMCMGDSWFTRYSNQFGTTLASLTGATVSTRALDGMTTEWALSWFDTYANADNPDICVFHFFTNDSNDLSAQTFTSPTGATLPRWPSGLTDAQAQEHWRNNFSSLIAKCRTRGIRPVIVNAGGTASQTQAQKHANWSWSIDRGASI